MVWMAISIVYMLHTRSYFVLNFSQLIFLCFMHYVNAYNHFAIKRAVLTSRKRFWAKFFNKNSKLNFKFLKSCVYQRYLNHSSTYKTSFGGKTCTISIQNILSLRVCVFFIFHLVKLSYAVFTQFS